MDTLTLFSKNLNQRSLTPRWPLTLCLLRSHVWLYPRIIVCKSHDNTSMYVDAVINFAKYHIHTYIHTHTYTYYVQNEWSHSLLLNSVQARQKWNLPTSASFTCVGSHLWTITLKLQCLLPFWFLSTSAQCYIISLQFEGRLNIDYWLTCINILASDGSCLWMSGALKMLSRYNQLRWQVNHSSCTQEK